MEHPIVSTPEPSVTTDPWQGIKREAVEVDTGHGPFTRMFYDAYAVDHALEVHRQQHRDALAAQAQEIADLKAQKEAMWARYVEEIGDVEALLMQVRSRLTAVEQGWQPMDTAPKDGRWVLLCEREWSGGPNLSVTMGKWCPSIRPMQEDAGWVRYGVGNIAAERLTHWMPLPSSPQTPEDR